MQITIQKMWPLEAGRKSGGFKGTDGVNYYCEIPIYHMLSEGMTIDPPAEKYVSKAGKTSYILDKKWSPNTVGAIIPNPAHQGPAVYTPSPNMPLGGNGYAAPPRQNGNGYAPKDEELITRLAILKSLIESGALLQGMGMDDLIALAWETAPKLKVWKQQ